MRRTSWRVFVLGNVTGLVVGVLLATAFFLVRPVGGEDELEPGELRILSGRDDSVGGQRQQLINLWNAAHPHNIATIVPLPEAADGQYAEMVARAGDENTDIFNLDVTWTAHFAESTPARGRLIRPIDESRLAEPAAEAFMAKPLATCRYRNALWALPFNTDAGLLYYRTDLGLGSAAQPPFDWPKLQQVTRTVLARPKPGYTAGFTSQLNSYEGLTVNLLEAVWSLGGDITIDARGQVSLDVALWNRALRLLSPARDDRVNMVLRDSLNFEETTSRSAFRNGKVIFMRNWPVAYRKMLTADGPRQGAKELNFDVAKLPGPSALGGQNLAISERTRKPRAAQALIEFLTGQHAQRVLFEQGGFAATRESVYEDEAVKSKYEYLPRLREAINDAKLRPVSPNYVAFSQRLSERAHDVLIGKEKALPDDLASQLTDALRGR